jgi:hypothetical protein
VCDYVNVGICCCVAQYRKNRRKKVKLPTGEEVEVEMYDRYVVTMASLAWASPCRMHRRIAARNKRGTNPKP